MVVVVVVVVLLQTPYGSLGLLFRRLFRRHPAHVHSSVQHVVDVLDRFVLGVDFPQRVAHDAQVASELRDQCHYFVRVAKDLHALRVRVVPHAERFLNAVRELSETHICTRASLSKTYKTM